MSRSAMWREEDPSGNRTWHSEDRFRAACDEGRSHKGALAIWGDDTSFHFNALLLKNCIQSSYFQKCCENLLNWSAVIDEIYFEVKNVSAFQGHQKQPSTAFCLLLRLLTLRMTTHQLNLTLKHADSPYIRAIGFLYLRFVGPPDQIYEWIEPYLYDEEELNRTERIDHKREAKAQNNAITMGTFVRYIFQSRDYYGETTLPRWPLAVERALEKQLLAANTVADRALEHFSNRTRMEYFTRVGNQVMAMYGDDEHPVTWYKAVVDRVVTRDESVSPEVPFKFPRFVVTFTEYGNVETVHLGEMDIIDGSSLDKSFQSGQRGSEVRRREYDDRVEENVRRREREKALNKGPARNYGHISSPPTNNSDSRGGHRSINSRDQDGKFHYIQRDESNRQVTEVVRGDVATTVTSVEAPRKRSAEEIAAIAEKKRKLATKYG